jgi:hypothetical protein
MQSHPGSPSPKGSWTERPIGIELKGFVTLRAPDRDDGNEDFNLGMAAPAPIDSYWQLLALGNAIHTRPLRYSVTSTPDISRTSNSLPANAAMSGRFFRTRISIRRRASFSCHSLCIRFQTSSSRSP